MHLGSLAVDIQNDLAIGNELLGDLHLLGRGIYKDLRGVAIVNGPFANCSYQIGFCRCLHHSYSTHFLLDVAQAGNEGRSFKQSLGVIGLQVSPAWAN